MTNPCSWFAQAGVPPEHFSMTIYMMTLSSYTSNLEENRNESVVKNPVAFQNQNHTIWHYNDVHSISHYTAPNKNIPPWISQSRCLHPTSLIILQWTTEVVTKSPLRWFWPYLIYESPLLTLITWGKSCCWAWYIWLMFFWSMQNIWSKTHYRYNSSRPRI